MYRQNLYLLKNRNNYFNRKLKYTNFKDLDLQTYLYYTGNNVNIATTNGVECEVIVNKPQNVTLADTVFPDYAVLEEIDDEDKTTLTYWFCLSFSKIRGTQYRAILRRDLLREYRDIILDAPCFVEKGFCDYSNPLFYNNENMEMNQIKIYEELIKDNIDLGPWIVGYIARSSEGSTYTVNATVDAYIPSGNIIEYDDLPTNIKTLISSQFAYLFAEQEDSYLLEYKFYANTQIDSEYFQVNTQFNKSKYITKFEKAVVTDTSNVLVRENQSGVLTRPHVSDDFNINLVNNLDMSVISNSITNYIESVQDEFITYEDYAKFNHIVYKRNENYFRLDLEFNPPHNQSLNISNNNALQVSLIDSLDETIKDLNNKGKDYIKVNNPVTGFFKFNTYVISATITTVSGNQVSVTIPESRAKLIDAPYDMFMIPFREYWIAKNGTLNRAFKEAQLNVACALSEALGSRLYDMQLLPYCPVRQWNELTITQFYNLDSNGLTEGIDYTLIKQDDNTIRGIVLFPKVSKAEFILPTPSSLWEDTTYTPYVDKFLNQVEKFRFVSPNYSSAYEFSFQKNGRNVPYMNITIDYKPFQPYIRVAPSWKGLNAGWDRLFYDSDLNDERGLICSGDFSLSQITSAWTDYQISNKNFQLMFDRDIKHIDTEYKITEDQLFGKLLKNSVFGTISGAVGGTISGAGALGAVAGGVSGLGASFIDTKINYDALQNNYVENRNYQIDKYNYSLQNIQAMPYTITKVSAFNPTNKIYPILEAYGATAKEKEVFINKLKYEGFTIMAVDKLSSYCDRSGENFVKGKIIRMEDAGIDTYIAHEIFKEVDKGFFIDINGYSSGIGD